MSLSCEYFNYRQHGSRYMSLLETTFSKGIQVRCQLNYMFHQDPMFEYTHVVCRERRGSENGTRTYISRQSSVVCWCSEVEWPSPKNDPWFIPLPFLVPLLRRIRTRVISLRWETPHGSFLRGGSFYIITPDNVKSITPLLP